MRPFASYCLPTGPKGRQGKDSNRQRQGSQLLPAEQHQHTGNGTGNATSALETRPACWEAPVQQGSAPANKSPATLSSFSQPSGAKRSQQRSAKQMASHTMVRTRSQTKQRKKPSPRVFNKRLTRYKTNREIFVTRLSLKKEKLEGKLNRTLAVPVTKARGSRRTKRSFCWYLQSS